MKTQIEQLIDRLADKSLTFGCKIKNKRFGYERIIAFSDAAGSYGGNVAYVPKPDEYVTGDQMDNYKDGNFEILGHPILIGDVLKKMNNLIVQDGWGVDVGSYDVAKLIKAWQPLGFTKSLQEILASTEWEWVNCKSNCPEPWCIDCEGIPKDKATRGLFEFLLQLDDNNEDE